MAFRKNKIAVIGAGHTGSTLSLFFSTKGTRRCRAC